MSAEAFTAAERDRLIPIMLAALREAEQALDIGNDDCAGEPGNAFLEPLTMVRAAIATATGSTS